MKLVLATSNKGKVREIKKMSEGFEVVPYTELINAFEIVEDADTFKENALIKARAVYAALNDEDAVVLADDSGISVEVLDGAPGIYSARFGGEDASDVDNLNKLVSAIKEKGFQGSPAFYTAAMALVSKEGELTAHGWMHGDVIIEPRGNKGFGYDPMFIPKGFENTLGELDDEVKSKLSHRGQALRLASLLLKNIQKQRGI